MQIKINTFAKKEWKENIHQHHQKNTDLRFSSKTSNQCLPQRRQNIGQIFISRSNMPVCRGRFNNQMFVFFLRNLFPCSPMCTTAVCFWWNRFRLTWALHYMSANKNHVRRDICSFRKHEELRPATDRLYIDAIHTFYSAQSQCWSLCRYGTPAILSHQKPWLLTYVCFPSP